MKRIKTVINNLILSKMSWNVTRNFFLFVAFWKVRFLFPSSHILTLLHPSCFCSFLGRRMLRTEGFVTLNLFIRVNQSHKSPNCTATMLHLFRVKIAIQPLVLEAAAASTVASSWINITKPLKKANLRLKF